MQNVSDLAKILGDVDLMKKFEEFLKSQGFSNPAPGGGKETHIAYVLDSSGSMSYCRDATIEGFNSSVDNVKRDAHLGGDVYVSLVTFGEGNTEVRVKYAHQSIDSLEKLTTETYVPQSGTPMYDGILETIKLLEEYDTPGGNKAFLVNIFTDGAENSSRKIDGPALSEKITALQKKGNWTFTVTGANINLDGLAQSIGIHRANMQAYTATPAGTKQAYASYSSSNSSYMANRGVGGQSVSDFYAGTPEDKQATSVVPTFPTPTGKKSKRWEDILKANAEEDDDNSLV
jgi:uncharacterized protein YegL